MSNEWVLMNSLKINEFCWKCFFCYIFTYLVSGCLLYCNFCDVTIDQVLSSVLCIWLIVWYFQLLCVVLCLHLICYFTCTVFVCIVDDVCASNTELSCVWYLYRMEGLLCIGLLLMVIRKWLSGCLAWELLSLIEMRYVA